MIDIVLTIHNKDFLIADVIHNLITFSSPAVNKLIMIFDGCTDNSYDVAHKALYAHNLKFKTQSIITDCIYETRANNLGMQTSNADYVIITQDDDILIEPNFDLKLLKPFQQYEDIIAISGRNSANMINKEPWFTDSAGERFGKIPDNEVIIRDISNRGPWMLDLAKAKQINYLDESFAPLDLDDADFCLRAYKEHRWVSGAVNIQLTPRNEANGGTRCTASTKRYVEPNGVVRQVIWVDEVVKHHEMIKVRHAGLLMGPKHNETRILV